MALYSKRYQIWQWACEQGKHVRTAQVMRRFGLNAPAASRHCQILESCGAMTRSPLGQKNAFAYLANPLKPPQPSMGRPKWVNDGVERDICQPVRRVLKFAPLTDLVSPEFIEIARLLECAPLARPTFRGFQ